MLAKLQKLKFKYRAGLFLTLILVVVGLGLYFISHHDIAVMSPAGEVASREKRLIVSSVGLMMIVILTVFTLTFYIAWTYRESNQKAKYAPDWDRNIFIESLWWGIPLILITIISVMAWNSSHELEPNKSLGSKSETMTIQVVALQWKWLFVYPKQNIATVNYVRFPVNQPVKFQITADAPMNSFWIPKLGGQIYAMSGMSTELNLRADQVGRYHGVSANISGEGFAGMKFVAEATNQSDFNEWLDKVGQSKQKLYLSEYDQLRMPTKDEPVAYYSSVSSGLYDSIIKRFMEPMTTNNSGSWGSNYYQPRNDGSMSQ